jgi:dUTP pyrophosphatase
LNIVTKLDNYGLNPYRAHETDAGADLFSNTEVHIYPGEQEMIDTGVAIKIPVGYVGFVFNRSSQGKIGVQIANGTGIIDSGYTATVKVLLKNNGEEPYFIYPYSTRIAQLVISPIILAKFVEFEGTEEEWNDTERGTGGFGSTGV